jgi:transposase InsO family protein
LLRQYAWFPNIDKAAKEEIDTCLPCQVKSDNGPPFNGNEFKTYLTKLGVTHETSRPEWPQGNSVAEAL